MGYQRIIPNLPKKLLTMIVKSSNVIEHVGEHESVQDIKKLKYNFVCFELIQNRNDNCTNIEKTKFKLKLLIIPMDMMILLQQFEFPQVLSFI